LTPVVVDAEGAAMAALLASYSLGTVNVETLGDLA